MAEMKIDAEVAKEAAKKGVLAAMLAPVGYTIGHLVRYGLSLGSIGGAVPADLKIYFALAAALLGLLM